jgi:hypothetical protein
MSSLVINGDTSGSITLAAPAVAGSTTYTLPAATGTVMVSGNMPTFSAYMTNGGSNQTLSSGTFTKVKLDTENWDTNNNFDSTTNYRFTPTVAGYYQINGSANISYGSTAPNNIGALIYKNGSAYRRNFIFTNSSAMYGIFIVSSIIYFNGSTDYVELYAYQTSSGDAFLAPNSTTSQGCFLDGCLLRTA